MSECASREVPPLEFQYSQSGLRLGNNIVEMCPPGEGIICCYTQVHMLMLVYKDGLTDHQGHWAISSSGESHCRCF